MLWWYLIVCFIVVRVVDGDDSVGGNGIGNVKDSCGRWSSDGDGDNRPYA